jgi:hypothetical protein
MSTEHLPHSQPTAHPIGHPFTSTTNPPLTSVNDGRSALNDGAHTGTTPPPKQRRPRIEHHDLIDITAQLSARDIAIIRSIADHQFLTVRQIERLHFADHAPISGARIARRTLARLRKLQLLGSLVRRVGGVRAGSSGLIHYVDAAGLQVIEERSRRVGGFREPSARFVRHRLAVADAHLALIDADRRGHFELVEVAVEPASWRRFTGIGGAQLTLKADLYAETATPHNELTHAWFIEIDLGTEGLQTLLKKCHDYDTYRQSGREQAESGGFPLVIWSMTHPDAATAERRRRALAEAIAADRNLPTALFRIVAPEGVLRLIRNRGEQ